MGFIEIDPIYDNSRHDLKPFWRRIGFLLSYELNLIAKGMTETNEILTSDLLVENYFLMIRKLKLIRIIIS